MPTKTITVKALAGSYIARERSTLGRRGRRTVDLHEQRLRLHIVPALGPTAKAADLHVRHVRKVVDKLNTKGLSGSTVRGCVSAMSAMFAHGSRDLGVMGRNPTRDLERGELPSGKRQTEPRYLSVMELEAIFDLMSDDFRPIAETCFWAGLRISEALGQTWGSISFKAATVNVSGTKTHASKALVPMHPKLASALEAHRERQAARGFDRIRPDTLVFQTRTGKSPGRRNALRALQRAAVRAGFVQEGQEPVGCHDLRHSLAANVYELGLNDVEVMRLLRHANAQVTRTVYAGITDTAVAALGGKLEALGR